MQCGKGGKVEGGKATKVRGIGGVGRWGGEVRVRAEESKSGVKVEHFVGGELAVEPERVQNNLGCGEQGAFAGCKLKERGRQGVQRRRVGGRDPGVELAL